MPFINCKIELKLKWTKYCVLFAAGAEYNDANSNNIIFTIKATKLYILVVTLSAKDYQNPWKLFSKGFGRSVCRNKYKTKGESRNTRTECRYLLESNFAVVNKLFVLVYSN